MSDVLDNLGTSNNFTGNKVLPNATATLVLGIISIATCWIYGLPGLICGIIAIVLHNKDKKIYMEDPQSYEASYKNLKAGYICGIIGLSLSALFILYIIIVLSILGTAFMSMSKY
ncbi:MAG: hypothetical protein K0R65_643 [Crocinitomicaceae bacterium]|jgi:hypothetical protein|nr:hypothetical protein [Crocinitomicaceae bacterium]